MKRIFIVLVAMVMTICAKAQNEPTKFLGIPVDGTKQQVIQKLKAKGYQYDATLDCLTGEFNGRNVNIYVVTNNNKVYRIMVADAKYVSETDIIIRFNTLCSQFEKNERYIKSDMLGDYRISDKEDISYEMTVNNKRYQASYYQITQKADSATIANYLSDYIKENYGSEEDIAKLSEDEQTQMFASVMIHALDFYSDNSVWFMISEHYGRYGILMYYDNRRNQANGEDL